MWSYIIVEDGFLFQYKFLRNVDSSCNTSAYISSYLFPQELFLMEVITYED